MITDAIESLVQNGYKFAHFAWSHAPEGDYGTWGEDSGNEFTAGDVVAETVMNGFVDYFTRDDSGAPKETIENAMTDEGIVFHLDAVQYESDTGYIHYTWEYFENG